MSGTVVPRSSPWGTGLSEDRAVAGEVGEGATRLPWTADVQGPVRGPAREDETLPPASSREILGMVEALGLAASWSWTFEPAKHVWSESLRRILGLPADVAADFGLLHRLIHPDDRPGVPGPDEVTLAGFLREQRFRVLRPDGIVRTVWSRGEVHHSPSGRPLRVVGVLVDVSDREAIARAKAAQKRHNRVIFETLKAFTSTTTTYPYTDFSDEFVELVGIPKDELLEDPMLSVHEDERRHWQAHGHEQYVTGQIVHTSPRLILADREVVQYRMVMVPMRNAEGRIEGWSNFVAPLHLRSPFSPDMTDALERQIEGRHIRAGRALLDWTMADLAKASALSISTVRRIEDDADARPQRSARGLIESLRRHGVRFTITDDGSIVLSKR